MNSTLRFKAGARGGRRADDELHDDRRAAHVRNVMLDQRVEDRLSRDAAQAD
jgi:hypothetical protein